MTPIDPVQTAAWTNSIIQWSLTGLNGFIARQVIPSDVNAAMVGWLNLASARVNDPVWWPNAVALLNQMDSAKVIEFVRSLGKAA
jgi:hypothetical protein